MIRNLVKFLAVLTIVYILIEALGFVFTGHCLVNFKAGEYERGSVWFLLVSAATVISNALAWDDIFWRRWK